MISDAEAEKALDYIRDNAAKIAVSRANRIYVEEFRKTVKAQIMKEHISQPLGAQEREAYADERYKQHLQAIKEAVEADEYQRWMMEAASAKVSAWQTQSRNSR
jgi:ABC-type enterochelin transport system substrate-binding protein